MRPTHCEDLNVKTVAKLQPESSKAGVAQVGQPSDRALLEQVLAEVVALRGEVAELRADLRRGPSTAAFPAAIEECFGAGHFTVAGLLRLADDDPHSAIGEALSQLVDWQIGAHARAVKLGTLLGRMPELEIVGEGRGVKVYRLRV